MIAKNKYIIFSFGLLAIDQVAKHYFYAHPAKAGFFGYYLNQNFFWSLPITNTTVIILTIMLLLGLAYWHSKLFGPPLAWFLIGSGAASNLIDRLARGGVVDYVFLPYGGIINLADILIIGGVVLIICSRK